MNKQNNNAEEALALLRVEINEIDAALVPLLNRRMAVSKRVAAVKKPAGLPVYQPEREAQLLAKVTALAEEKEAVLAVYAAILQESRRLQK